LGVASSGRIANLDERRGAITNALEARIVMMM